MIIHLKNDTNEAAAKSQVHEMDTDVKNFAKTVSSEVVCGVLLLWIEDVYGIMEYSLTIKSMRKAMVIPKQLL